MCYIPTVLGWAQGLGVLLIKNRSRYSREVGDLLVCSVSIFMAIWVDKWVKQHKRCIFELNMYATAHGFGGGLGARS